MPSSLRRDHPFASVRYAPAHLRRSAVRSPVDLPSGFSWHPRLSTLASGSPQILALPPQAYVGSFTPQHPTRLDAVAPPRRDTYHCAPPHSVKRSTGGTRLSTRCPSPTGHHPLGLGPANPTRTYLASEPLGFRRASFPLALSLLIPASALLTTPPTFPGQLLRCEDAPLPKDNTFVPSSPRLRRRA